MEHIVGVAVAAVETVFPMEVWLVHILVVVAVAPAEIVVAMRDLLGRVAAEAVVKAQVKQSELICAVVLGGREVPEALSMSVTQLLF